MKPIKLPEKLNFWEDIFPQIFFEPSKMIHLRLESLNQEYIRAFVKSGLNVYIYDIRDRYHYDYDKKDIFDPNYELFRLCYFFSPLFNKEIFNYYLNVLFTFFFEKYSIRGKTLDDYYAVSLFGIKEDENGFIGDKRVLLAIKPKDKEYITEEIDKDSSSTIQKGYRFFYAIPENGKPKMFQADIEFIKLDFLNKNKNEVNFTVVFDKSKYQEVKIKDANHDYVAKVYCDYIKNKYKPSPYDDFVHIVETTYWFFCK
jgi:hypothetical protein